MLREAAASIDSLDLLINNAGVQPFDDLSDPAALEQTLAVNLFGTYRVRHPTRVSGVMTRLNVATSAI